MQQWFSVPVYTWDVYGGREVQNKSRFWKQYNKLQMQMQI